SYVKKRPHVRLRDMPPAGKHRDSAYARNQPVRASGGMSLPEGTARRCRERRRRGSRRQKSSSTRILKRTDRPALRPGPTAPLNKVLESRRRYFCFWAGERTPKITLVRASRLCASDSANCNPFSASVLL